MNIFYLDSRPHVAAKDHCDKHVVKMILESAQMLCTAHRELDGDVPDVFYKSTHKNHPSTIWARSKAGNYRWLYDLFVSLCDEYTYRYGKVHLSDKKFRASLLVTQGIFPSVIIFSPLSVCQMNISVMILLQHIEITTWVTRLTLPSGQSETSPIGGMYDFSRHESGSDF